MNKRRHSRGRLLNGGNCGPITGRFHGSAVKDALTTSSNRWCRLVRVV